MVQYKRMTQENDETSYRPMDKSYERELARMQDFERTFLKGQQGINLEQYRLHPGGFYFKLCPYKVFDPTSLEMIPGMYLPLDYWEHLVNSPTISGSKGGKRITYRNVGRHLYNSFVDLAKAGWIGSRGIQTTAITEIIQEAISDKKSVVLAALRKVNDMDDQTEISKSFF
jgi:hypothetical protein